MKEGKARFIMWIVELCVNVFGKIFDTVSRKKENRRLKETPWVPPRRRLPPERRPKDIDDDPYRDF